MGDRPAAGDGYTGGVTESASSSLKGGGLGVRELMLAWCLWLLGSWAVTLSIASPQPGVRWMVLMSAVGLLLGWPAFRLSQSGEADADAAGAAAGPGAPPVLLVLFDWVCLMLIFQAVVWPLRLVGGWTFDQAAWLAIAMAAWSLLAGAIVAVGRQFESGGVRALAMAGCVLLVLGEPLVMALSGVEGGWRMRVSPIGALWEVTGRAHLVRMEQVSQRVTVVAVAAAVAWVGLMVLAVASRRVSRGRGH
jgi:hypothetical protein